jgi:hypothetical protein
MKNIWWCLLLIGQLSIAKQAFTQNGLEDAATPKDDIHSGVFGNPYLFKDWSDGVIRFTSGRVLTQFKLKFDCLKNQLLLQFQGSTFAAESKVKEFVLYKSGKQKDSLLFRKGYPAAEKATEETYYQVLFEGKIALLRLFAKNIIEEKQSIPATTTRRLEDAELFFLLKDGIMITLPQDRNDLPKIFPDKSELLSKFIAEQQLRMRTAEDFIQVAKKFNELL